MTAASFRAAGLYRARAGHPLEPGHEASQVPGGRHSGEAAPNEPLPSLLGGQLYQLAMAKAHSCMTRFYEHVALQQGGMSVCTA